MLKQDLEKLKKLRVGEWENLSLILGRGSVFDSNIIQLSATAVPSHGISLLLKNNYTIFSKLSRPSNHAEGYETTHFLFCRLCFVPNHFFAPFQIKSALGSRLSRCFSKYLQLGTLCVSKRCLTTRPATHSNQVLFSSPKHLLELWDLILEWF